MAKKSFRVTPPAFEPQIDAALLRGHFSVALELARKYDAQHPSEQSRAKLRRVYLDYLTVLSRTGKDKEAATVLVEAEKLNGDLAWWEQLAFFHAGLGNYSRAADLATQTGQPHLVPRLLQRLIDFAVSRGGAGKKLLPAEFHTPFELILKAFQAYEFDRSDEVREAIQSIGLQSPFLEWKVMLRGLLAYSAKDDPRAIENWSRLDPKRLPSNLVEPLRLEIDANFRKGLSSHSISKVEKRLSLLRSDSLPDQLLQIHRQLTSGDTLSEVWPAIRPIYSGLKQQFPSQAMKVQNALYWALSTHGGPRDVDEFYKSVGAHPADPQTTRLRALIMESLDGELEKAHRFWNEYQQWIEKNPQRWPSGQAQRARAIIWLRMGKNAQDVLDELKEDRGQDSLRNPFFELIRPQENAKPLKPDAITCFNEAAKLAPDWVEPLSNLFRLHFMAEEFEKAAQIASEMVTKFPNDLQTLEAAEKVNTQLGRTKEALDYARRAYQTNPLDRRLRERLSLAAFGHARAQMAENDFEAARVILTEAGSLANPSQMARILCLSAILEEKAGNLAGAGSIRDQLAKAPSERLAVIYRLAVEAGQVKLPAKRKKELDAALKEIMELAPEIRELIPLMGAVADYDRETVKYRGFLTHAKKIRAMAEKAITPATSHEDLRQLGFQLLQLKSWPSLLKLANLGMRYHPQNAYFPYFEAEYAVRNPARPHRSMLLHGYREATRIIRESTPGMYRDLDEPLKRLESIDPWLGQIFRMDFDF